MIRGAIRARGGALGLVALATLVTLAPPGARADGWAARLDVERRVSELAASDRAVRREAARTLGLVGEHERAVEALTEALGSEVDADVRTEIADALARRGDARAIEALVANVTRMRITERAARVRALAAIDRPAARRALAAALGGEAADTALARIVEIGAPMVEALLPLLDVPASAARAARALGEIGDRGAVASLIARLEVDDLATRTAMIDALGRIGDERAATALSASIAHEDPSVAIAALRALARVASRDAGDAVHAQLARDDPEVAAAALEALATIDPERARPALEDALAGAEPARRAAAWAAIVALPDEAFVPLLVQRAGDDAQRGVACDALARISEGGGVASLLALAGRDGGDASAALARALRRWEAPGGLRERALAELARESDVDRALVLRAIARDGDAEGAMIARLGDAEPSARASAASALAMLGRGSDHARAALRRAAATETDGVALEAIARAADRLGGALDPPSIDALRDPARAPAALMTAAIAADPARPRERRELRGAVLDALRARAPRTRVLAIHALAVREDREARTAIAAAIEDGAGEVRLAAASALGALRATEEPGLRARIASRLAIEPDPDVRRALRDALDGAHGRAGVRGDECLHVRLDHPGVTDVEVWLPDGRWLRARTLRTGELVVCDLPTGDADVRLAP